MHLGIACSVAIWSSVWEIKEAEAFFKKAYEMYQKLYEKNPEKYKREFANVAHNLATMYDMCEILFKQREETEKYYRKALITRRELAKSLHPEDLGSLAATCDGLAAFLSFEKERQEEVRALFQEVLHIYGRLAVVNPKIYEYYYAVAINHYMKHLLFFGNEEEAETMTHKFFAICRTHPELGRLRRRMENLLEYHGIQTAL